MALLDSVKPRIGIFYSDTGKDAEVQGMIDAAKEYFKNAGWDVGDGTSPLAVDAIVLYCKMAQSTDPLAMINHPVLMSFIAQGRAVVPDVEV